MVLPKKEKKELVIKLYNEGKTTREIVKIARMSLKDIGIIFRELNREPEAKPPLSAYAKAFAMFSKGKTPIEVSIKLDLSYKDINQFFAEYSVLNNKKEFIRICEKYEEHLPFLVSMAEKMKNFELFDTDVNLLIDYLSDFHTQ